MPLVTYCREVCPDAQITVIADQRNAPLLPYLTGFDQSSILPRGNKYLALLRTGMKHWWPRLDIAIAAKTSPSRLNCFTPWAFWAKNRVAVTHPSLARYFVNRPVSPQLIPEGTLHQALATLKLIAPDMHKIPRRLYPKLTLSDYIELPHGSSPWLFVSMTNNRETSSLGVEGHSTLLSKLAKNHDFRVVISCEERDLGKAKRLQQQLKMESILRPTHSIHELIMLLNAVDAVFVGDGGIMHLAAALNKPQTVLFGRDIVTQWRPLSDAAECLSSIEHVQKIPQDHILDSLSRVIQKHM